MARGRLLQAVVGLGVLTAGTTMWYWNRPTAETPVPGLHGYKDGNRHAATDRVEYLDQGWTPKDSADFYSRTQGSRLIPYDWFLALERAGPATPFAESDHLASFGYLPQRTNATNPDGLPVGFVKDPRHPREGRDWLGLTCAACHTAELHRGGVAYRIDGGPGYGDLQAFLAALTAAMRATADDPAKFARFTAKLKLKETDLRPEFLKAVAAREKYERDNATPVPHGPARLDAFGRIVNTVLCDALGVGDASQVKPPDAPVSYPPLWDTPHHDYVQWNAVARNKIRGSDQLGGLARNVGEVLGVFGTVDISEPNAALMVRGYPSSVRVPDLIALEELVRKLQSPKWPAAFPPTDEPARAAGAKLFESYCSRCHADIDRSDPLRSITAVKTPIKVVGTDPRMAVNFAERTGKSGRVEGRREDFAVGPRFGPTARADDLLVHVVVGTVLGSPWKNYRASDVKLVRDKANADPDRLLVYKARPLNGIWATGPFLHNGSVPTLDTLLRPATERPKVFRMTRVFDAVKVGLADGEAGFEFDTRLTGNSNAGHEYGTGGDGKPALTDSERRQLVEYLKSL